MRRTLITALLLVFLFLSVASALFMYNTHTIPIEETVVTPLYTYTNRGTYNYVASLKPNTVYDNKTTLRPGEGPVYRRITNEIAVNFSYTFEGSESANLTIHCNVSTYVETPKWTKRISELPITTITTKGTEATVSIGNIAPVNASLIEDLVKEVQADTGIPISVYSANIKTGIHIEAETPEGPVNATFSPELTMEFQSSKEEGDIIAMSSLENFDSGRITETTTIYYSWVELQRYISYALSTIAFSGLILTTWLFMRTRPRKPPEPEKMLEDFIAPYQEIIAEIIYEPRVEKPQQAPVSVVIIETLEDLVKIAEILGKPILHTYQPPENHTFYVFDGTIRYEFTITLSSIIERKTHIEMEEDEWENNQN